MLWLRGTIIVVAAAADLGATGADVARRVPGFWSPPCPALAPFRRPPILSQNRRASHRRQSRSLLVTEPSADPRSLAGRLGFPYSHNPARRGASWMPAGGQGRIVLPHAPAPARLGLSRPRRPPALVTTPRLPPPHARHQEGCGHHSIDPLPARNLPAECLARNIRKLHCNNSFKTDSDTLPLY